MFFTALSSSFYIYAFVLLGYGLWASYQSGFVRIRVLSDFLQSLLDKTITDTKAIHDGKLNLSDAINPVSELHGWLKARRYYTDLVLHLGNNLANWATAANLLIFILFNLLTAQKIYHDAVVQSLPVSMLIENIWPNFIMLVVLTSSAIIPLKKASDMYTEMENQRSLLRNFIVEYELCLNSFSIGPDGDNSDAAEDVFSVSDCVSNMADLLDEFDEPPRVLGIPITPVIVQTIIGYVASGLGGLVAFLINTGDI